MGRYRNRITKGEIICCRVCLQQAAAYRDTQRLCAPCAQNYVRPFQEKWRKKQKAARSVA